MTISFLSIGFSNKFGHSNDPKRFSRKREVEHHLVHRIEKKNIFMSCFIEQKENLYNSVMELNGLING